MPAAARPPAVNRDRQELPLTSPRDRLGRRQCRDRSSVPVEATRGSARAVAEAEAFVGRDDEGHRIEIRREIANVGWNECRCCARCTPKRKRAVGTSHHEPERTVFRKGETIDRAVCDRQWGGPLAERHSRERKAQQARRLATRGDEQLAARRECECAGILNGDYGEQFAARCREDPHFSRSAVAYGDVVATRCDRHAVSKVGQAWDGNECFVARIRLLARRRLHTALEMQKPRWERRDQIPITLATSRCETRG